MGKIKESEFNKILNWYLVDLKSCSWIGKQYGVSYATIVKILKDLGIKVINRQNQHIWTDADLINDFNNGLSGEQIRKKWGIDKSILYSHLKKHRLRLTNYQNQCKFNEHVFDCIDTEEKAYWLGFIFADGYISSHTPNKKKTYRFELSLAIKDKDHLDKFNIFMGYLGNNVKCDSYRCRWFIGNKHLWTTLNNYGCTPRKSLTLKFPDKTIFKSKDLIRHFIRGYFDGDGCVTLQKNKYSIRPYVSIIGTWEFLNSIEHYLNYPTLAKIYKDKRSQKNTYTLWFKTIESFDFLDKVYENATIYLNRKYNRYLQTILPF